jgi:hypothetical protein
VFAAVAMAAIDAVLSEVHRTWNRPDAGEFAKLYVLCRACDGGAGAERFAADSASIVFQLTASTSLMITRPVP